MKLISALFSFLVLTAPMAFGTEFKETPIGPIVAVEIHSNYSVKDCERDFDGAQCQSDSYEAKRNEFWKVIPRSRGSAYPSDFYTESPLTIGRKQYVIAMGCSRAGVTILIAKNGWAIGPNKDITWPAVSATIDGLFQKLEQAGGCKSILYRASN